MEHILWYTGHDLKIPNMVRGDNCYLYDSDGKRYIDLESGLWYTSIGHCNPRINQVIKNQIDRINHTGYCYANDLIEESAKTILKTLNFPTGKCVFLSSGSEAVEFGVRIAQTISEKPLLMTMSDSYFGDYGSANKKEVTTSIGRTGKWYGFQHYFVQPDIVALGKGLGNGYPVSVSALNDKIVQKLKNISLKYSQSHQNDPLGASIAREVIHVIQDLNLIERGKNIGTKLINNFNQIQKVNKSKKEIRGRGLMIAIEFDDEKDTNLASLIQKELLGNGFITVRRPGLNVIRIDPPMTIEEENIDAFLNCFRNLLNNLSKTGHDN